jgi:Spx/MgsR family transcriptional regulator
VAYTRRDYFKQRFTREELSATLERAGLTPADALSKRSRAYKELGLADRPLSDGELLELMVREPTLLRRPLIISSAGVEIGYNQERLRHLIDSPG